jgi:hypothetical protein
MYTQLLAVLHCVISLILAEVSTVPSIVVCAHVHTCIRVRLCTALLPLTTAATDILTSATVATTSATATNAITAQARSS